jgi:hypothetical protein
MGWTKRDSDVAEVRRRHERSVTFMRNASSVSRLMAGSRKPIKKGTARMASRIPEEMDGYITLSHMVGQQPDKKLLWDALHLFAQAFDKIKLRRRAL